MALALCLPMRAYISAERSALIDFSSPRSQSITAWCSATSMSLPPSWAWASLSIARPISGAMLGCRAGCAPAADARCGTALCSRRRAGGRQPSRSGRRPRALGTPFPRRPRARTQQPGLPVHGSGDREEYLVDHVHPSRLGGDRHIQAALPVAAADAAPPRAGPLLRRLANHCHLNGRSAARQVGWPGTRGSESRRTRQPSAPRRRARRSGSGLARLLAPRLSGPAANDTPQ